MKPQLNKSFKAILLLFITFLFLNATWAQQSGKIDWKNDTITKTEARGANDTYKNTIRGSGQSPTQQVNLPVDKLNEILDACSANGVSEVAVLFISLRQQDIARYKKNNPGTTATDAELKGSQMLVIKVPRRAFSMKAGAKINLSANNLLAVSLLSAGLVQLKESYTDLPFAEESIYFSIGKICPPPASCDTID